MSPRPRKDGTTVAVRAACPKCTANAVGLVRAHTHLVWDVHTYTTWAGTRLHCAASAQHLCECPARDARSVTGLDVPHCPHESP